MPKRLNTQFIKNQFEKYGYKVPKDFKYKNNITHVKVFDEYNNCYEKITYKMLMYRIKNGRPERIDNPFDIMINMGLNQNENQIDSRSSMARYEKRFGGNVSKTIKNHTEQLIKKFMKKQTFTIKFEDKENFEDLYVVKHALEIVAPKIDKDIKMTIETKSNEISYAHVNQNTIDILGYLLENKDFNMSDSNDVLLFNIFDYKQKYFNS